MGLQQKVSMVLLRTTRSLDQRHAIYFMPSLRRLLSVSSNSAVDMASKEGELRVFMVAGEVSGDTIGSHLMASMKKLSPFPARFAGVGGCLMSKHGLKSLFPIEDIAVMGIWELLPHLHKFSVRLKQTVEAAVVFRPHAVVTVDSKGFSFRFLKQLRPRYNEQGAGIPSHFHYVAPSFWTWKGGEARLQGLSKFVDHVLCILPFEEEVCKLNGIDATFVGHPILEDVLELNMGKETAETRWKVHGDAEAFRSQYGLSSGSRIFSLLPGSRLQEVTRMLPIFSSTMKLLKDSIPELTTVVHVAPNKHVENHIKRAVTEWPMSVILLPGGSLSTKYDAFDASTLALCTSGTVALELQLARLPCVVSYRAHLVTEWFIRYRAKVPYISLPNILLNSPIIPEVLFQACTPSKLAPLLMELMHDEELRQKQVDAAEKVMEILSPPTRHIQEPMHQDLRTMLPNNTPSMIAASTILYTQRKAIFSQFR